MLGRAHWLVFLWLEVLPVRNLVYELYGCGHFSFLLPYPVEVPLSKNDPDKICLEEISSSWSVVDPCWALLPP